MVILQKLFKYLKKTYNLNSLKIEQLQGDEIEKLAKLREKGLDRLLM